VGVTSTVGFEWWVTGLLSFFVGLKDPGAG
jgi:hypothetical protein